MNMLSGPPGSNVDIRDPRIRYTFADVAMRIAHDGPWYFVLIVILVLVLHGTTSTSETLHGLALALLARSKPPEQPDKAHLVRTVASGLGVLVLFGALHVALGGPAPRGRLAGDAPNVSVVK